MARGKQISTQATVVLAVSALIALAMGIWGFNTQGDHLQNTLAASDAQAGQGPSANANVNPQTGTKLGPLLSSMPYARAAYPLYPGPIDSNTQRALEGFTVSFSHAGNLVTLTVNVLGSSQPPVQRTFDASDKVYFIETRMGDDSNGNGDDNFGDDGLVITDASGHILQSN